MTTKEYTVTSIATGLSYPNGIVKSKDGYFFVADQNSNLIRKLTPQKDGTYQNEVYSGHTTSGYTEGTLKDAYFYFIGNIVLDKEENLFVSDSWNHCIRMISGNNVTTFLPKTFKIPSNESVTIRENRAMTIDRNLEHLYFVDTSGKLFKIQLPSARCVATFQLPGLGGLPRGLAMDNDNNFYYSSSSQILKAVNFDFDNPQVITEVSDCRSLLLDKYATNLYIGTNSFVYRYSFASKTLTSLCKMDWATALALDGKGNLLVCEYNTGNVKSIKLGGAVPWSLARIVWIGNMKNSPKYSPFARLPKDMVKEILLFCNDYY